MQLEYAIIVSKQGGRLMDRFSELARLLLTAINGKNALENMMNIGYQWLKNPLHMTDTTGRLLAAASEAPYVDDIWRRIETAGYIDYETYRHTCRPNIDIMNTSFVPTILNDAPGHVNLLVYGIAQNNIHLANLIVIEKFKPFSEQDKACLSLIGRSAALLLKPPGHIACKTPKEFLLYELLTSSQKPPHGLQERSKIVGLPLSGSFHIVTICSQGALKTDSFFHPVKRLLSALWPDSPSILYNNQLVALLPSRALPKNMPEKSGLMPLLKKHRLTAALSLPFHSLGEAYSAYMQTLQVLNSPAAASAKRCFYEYKDYMLYHALSLIESPDDFCHPCISRLMAYDNAHQTDYTRTLYLYIMNFRSLKDTAKAMNIHYNTLKYRLTKLYEITAPDVDNPDTFLLLYLSFKVMQLHGHLF